MPPTKRKAPGDDGDPHPDPHPDPDPDPSVPMENEDIGVTNEETAAAAAVAAANIQDDDEAEDDNDDDDDDDDDVNMPMVGTTDDTIVQEEAGEDEAAAVLDHHPDPVVDVDPVDVDPVDVDHAPPSVDAVDVVEPSLAVDAQPEAQPEPPRLPVVEIDQPEVPQSPHPHPPMIALDDSDKKRRAVGGDPPWNAMLFQLVYYKAIHGDLRPKSKDEEHKPLADWMVSQRKEFKIYQETPDKSYLTPDQVKVLDHLQFPWNTRGDEHWFRNYEHLKQFRKDHSHCMVPRTFVDVPNLCHWVTDQRRQLKNLKGGKPSTMTKDRQRLLDDIQFVWQVRNRTTWDTRFAELIEFKEQKNTTVVPQHYSANKALGKWVAKQREQFKLLKKGEHSFLTPDRLEQLNSIGFVWSMKGRTPKEEEESAVLLGHQDLEDAAVAAAKAAVAAAVQAEDEKHPPAAVAVTTTNDQQQQQRHDDHVVVVHDDDDQQHQQHQQEEIVDMQPMVHGVKVEDNHFILPPPSEEPVHDDSIMDASVMSTSV